MTSYKLEKIFVVSLFSLFAIFILLWICNPKTQQRNIFFRQTQDYFADYHNVANYSESLNPYQYGITNGPRQEERIYPPFVYVIFHLLGKIGEQGKSISTMALTVSNLFMFYCSFMLFLALYEGYKGPKIYKLSITSALFFSSIFLFSYERGNIIMLSAACVAFFIFNYKSNNKIIRELALISLAFAAGLKLSPALLGLLLIFEKRWKEAARTIIYGLILIFIPFLFIEGGFNNINIWLKSLGLNNEIYNFRQYPRFNFRYWASAFYFMPYLQALIYKIFSCLDIILGLFAVSTAFFQNIRWKQIMQLLLVFSILLINSGQYTGLYLFTGVILFFNSKEHDRLDGWFLLLFILLFSPLRIIFINVNNVVDLSTLLMNFSASIMLIILSAQSTKEAIKFLKTKYRK